MIDGKLAVMDKEPQNVQVVTADTEEGGVECLVLQDETGVFLRIRLTRIKHAGKMRAKAVELTKAPAPVTEDTLQAELEEARRKQTEMVEQLVSQQTELDSAVEALAGETELRF